MTINNIIIRWKWNVIIAEKKKKKKFTAMITFHFNLQPQYKYELFHIKTSH